ncbi:MAG: chromosome segregation protein SMC [Clostridia bacterium]|nr:chromosome segregation protein SMC [Clostridia bacterium]
MFLKRIEIQGFKSFADKTVLEFEQGVTSIVGPNGSGKSNIADAIRWVMGEMSIKSLRGASMQDVIFAGTQTRKPVNFAEVSLVLDNSNKTFPIDFEEVIVTRRVFRSGESVYMINRASCRLKDIHELFMDTGLGRDGYSIIGQGNVSQILSTKSEDRRSIFEEAAGISKYKHRKEDAQRKLESVSENLIRIKDIISELETQLLPLGEQAEKARQYLMLYEEYKGLDVSVSFAAIEKNRKLLSETQMQYKSVNDELTDLKEHEGELERTLNALYEESRIKDIKTEEMNKTLRENESKIMSLENKISIFENNVKNNSAMLLKIDNEVSSIEKQIESLLLQIENIKNEIMDLKENSKKLLEEFDEIQAQSMNFDEELKSRKSIIEEHKSDMIACMNEVSSDKARVSGIDNLKKSFTQRRDIVMAELKSHIEGLENTKGDIEKNRALILEKRQKLTEMQERVNRFSQRKSKAEQLLQEYAEELGRLNVEYNSKASKKRMLEDMENEYEGYTKSVRAVLKAQELKGLAIYGTISGLISVKKEYVTAIEIALGGALQNIVVEDEQVAKSAIEYLKRINGGRATFLPVSSVQGQVTVPDLREYEGFIGVASELVSCDRKYQQIIKNLLGRTAVVDNIDNAISISRTFGYKFRIVTLDGDVVNAGGSMSGGSVNPANSFLSRANDIKTLAADLASLADNIKKQKDKVAEAEADMKNIENQLSSYIPMVREYEDELLGLEHTCVHLQKAMENSAQTKQSLTSELEQINEQLAKANEDIGTLISAISVKEDRIIKLNQEIEAFEEQYKDAFAQKEERAKLLMDKTVKLRSVEKDIQVAKDRIRAIENDIAAKNADIQSKFADKARICEENDTLKKNIEEKRQEADEARTLSENIKHELCQLASEKENIVNKLQKLQGSNKDLTDKLILLQQEFGRIEAKKDKLSTEYDSIVNRLWDEYELTYTAAAEIRKEIENEKEALKRINELKVKMKALGSVNLDAIEEYKTVKTRFEFMSEQKSDLEKSKENLNKIIRSTQELMEEHFSNQFSKINKSFAEVFSELFGGGRGRLYLSEPDNILESGIEIEVQMPGKGLQNIDLYSGGEKSFIAIALLFAILKVKPTPFCILDEIDAALDDVNVSRFASYLRNYLSMTQFIVITHRRGTMEASNILYGVTMQEKGVSKLLSLHIDDIKDEMAN